VSGLFVMSSLFQVKTFSMICMILFASTMPAVGFPSVKRKTDRIGSGVIGVPLWPWVLSPRLASGVAISVVAAVATSVSTGAVVGVQTDRCDRLADSCCEMPSNKPPARFVSA